jgi:uncharacterized protein YpmB
VSKGGKTLDNVPSSVIITIVSVIIGAILGSMFILFYHSNGTTAQKVSSDMSIQKDSMTDGDLVKYDGIMMNGSAVLRTIRMMDDKDISIQVELQDKSGYYPYSYKMMGNGVKADGSITSSNVKADLAPSQKAYADRKQDYQNAKFSTNNSPYYIDPDAKFTAHLIRNENDAITGIAFERS